MKTASLVVDVILKLIAFFAVGVFGDGVNSVQFTKFTSLKCDDVAVCATSSPTRSFPVQSQGQCLLEGQSKRYLPQTFVGVNYREQNKVCEMFSANPTSFTYNVQGCQYMQKEVSTSVQCAAVNPCNTNNGGCSTDAKCQSWQGNTTCTCNAGYSGNGLVCTDINECQTNNGGCSPDATCTNNHGSFTCTCKVGFSGNGLQCSDINECQTNNGGCSLNATCTNNQGSFTCTCKVGFSGNGFQCLVLMQCIHGYTLQPTSSSGVITSMNYPNYYINNANCGFIITASSPYTVVRLTFTAFCTETTYDYVKVYDGNSSASPQLMSSSGCRNGTLPGPVTTTQRYMYVGFTTDQSASSTLLMPSSGCLGLPNWSGLPGPVTTTQRDIYVWFNSDGSFVYSGFSVTYNMQ